LRRKTVKRWLEAGHLTTAEAGALVPPLRKVSRCWVHALRALNKKISKPRSVRPFDLGQWNRVNALKCNVIAKRTGQRCRAPALPPWKIEELRREGHPAKFGQCQAHAVALTPGCGRLLQGALWWQRMSFAAAPRCIAHCSSNDTGRRGKRCQRPAQPGKKVCWHHGGAAHCKPKLANPDPKRWDKVRNGLEGQRRAKLRQQRLEAGEILGQSKKQPPAIPDPTPLWTEFTRGKRHD
jgi:hypothetical protein